MTLVVTWLWQGLALAALTAVVLRALPRVNAATHHLTLWTALAAILGIPLMLAAGSLRDQVGVLPLPPAGNGFDAALVLPAAPRWVAVLCGTRRRSTRRAKRGCHCGWRLAVPHEGARSSGYRTILPAPVRSGSVVRSSSSAAGSPMRSMMPHSIRS